MKIRNVKLVSDTEVVLEYNHPKLGWIPYTAIKDSGEEEMEEIFQEALKIKPDYDLSYLKNRVTHIESSKSNPDLDKYSDTERSMFNIKRMEAEKILNGGKSDLIEQESAISGTTPIELARKIVEKNNKSMLFETQKRHNVKRIKSDLSKITTYKKLKSYIEGLNNGNTNNT